MFFYIFNKCFFINFNKCYFINNKMENNNELLKKLTFRQKMLFKNFFIKKGKDIDFVNDHENILILQTICNFNNNLFECIKNNIDYFLHSEI